MNNCWKDMLTEAMEFNGESWSDVEANTMTETDMERMFSTGYGSTEGIPFTVWTKHRVYFPCEYDGSEFVESVARHPDGKPTSHIGS